MPERLVGANLLLARQPDQSAVSLSLFSLSLSLSLDYGRLVPEAPPNYGSSGPDDFEMLSKLRLGELTHALSLSVSRPRGTARARLSAITLCRALLSMAVSVSALASTTLAPRWMNIDGLGGDRFVSNSLV